MVPHGDAEDSREQDLERERRHRDEEYTGPQRESGPEIKSPMIHVRGYRLSCGRWRIPISRNSPSVGLKLVSIPNSQRVNKENTFAARTQLI